MTQVAISNRQGFAPTTMNEAMEFSTMLANSSMVPKAYQGKPMDIMVCVQWGMEMGLAPMQALQNIAVINGKPSVYGDAAMALVQASAVCEDVEEYFEGEGTPNPVAVCVAKRKGRKPVTAKFSVEDAKRAGLWAKQGPWSSYPNRMMQMRARGFALRDAFPDVLKGLITAEEAQDYPADLSQNANAIVLQKPANPLDVIKPINVTNQVVTDRAVIEASFEDTIENLAPVPTEVLELDPKVYEVFDEALPAEVNAKMFGIMVPGKTEPVSLHATIEEWQDCYEELAEKTSRAGRVLPRERMTILRELRECNEITLSKIDMIKRIRHTANYSKRINALGAAQ